MSELSVFIDESGDFGSYEHHAPYYIITLVFHNQSSDISYKSFTFKKREFSDHDQMVSRISREISTF